MILSNAREAGQRFSPVRQHDTPLSVLARRSRGPDEKECFRCTRTRLSRAPTAGRSSRSRRASSSSTLIASSASRDVVPRAVRAERPAAVAVLPTVPAGRTPVAATPAGRSGPTVAARATPVVGTPEAALAHRARCSRPPAPAAVARRKCPSGPRRASPSTATTALRAVAGSPLT